MFDGISGIGVSNFGHGHPAITDSLHAQLELNLHTMVYGEFIQDVQRQAAASLRFLAGALDSVYFVNSGAEAVDAALKLAKRLTGRTKIMGVEGGYHGTPMARCRCRPTKPERPRSGLCFLKCLS